MLIKIGLAMKKIKYSVRVKYGQTMLANKDYTQIVYTCIYNFTYTYIFETYIFI